jgi:hypothetical protein
MEVSDSSYQNDNDQLPLETLVIEGPTDTDHTDTYLIGKSVSPMRTLQGAFESAHTIGIEF